MKASRTVAKNRKIVDVTILDPYQVPRIKNWSGVGGTVRRSAAICVALALALGQAGCAVLDRRAHADDVARRAAMERRVLRTDTFTLTTYSRIRDPKQALRVYIEGDGLAWLSLYTVSPDPTPRDALALVLATEDPAANVAYVARPCQFTDMTTDRLCSPEHWTGSRFSEKVIVAVAGAIDQLGRRTPGQPVHLIGYSGGGAVAALVAARRADVASLTTIAGNLDVDTFVRIHNVTPMSGSLNPTSVARRLSGIPQRHFVGGSDDVVPIAVVNGFVTAADDTHCIRVITVPEASHEKGWKKLWPSLMEEPFGCGGRRGYLDGRPAPPPLPRNP